MTLGECCSLVDYVLVVNTALFRAKKDMLMFELRNMKIAIFEHFQMASYSPPFVIRTDEIIFDDCVAVHKVFVSDTFVSIVCIVLHNYEY